MRFLLAVLVCICFSLSYAEDMAHLEPQVITGEQTKEIGHQVQFFSRDQFIGQYTSVTDLLQNAIGIQVRKGGIGDRLQLSIRGSSHNQIDFIVDGHRINESKFGGFDPNKIPLSQIQSITIYQGAPSEDGSLASVGGTVVIETLSESDFKQTFYTGYATYNTISAGIIQSIPTSFPSMISYDYLSSEADYKYPVYTPYDEPNNFNNVESLHNNKYKSHSLLGKTTIKLTKNSKIGLKANIIDTIKEIPNYNQNPDQNSASFKTTEKEFQSFYLYQISSNLKNNTDLLTSMTNELFDDSEGFVGSGKNKDTYRNTTVSIKNTTSFQIDRLEGSIFLSRTHQDFDEKNNLISRENQCLSEEIGNCDIKANQAETGVGVALSGYTKSFLNSLHISAQVTRIEREQIAKYGDLEDISSEDTFNSWGVEWRSSLTESLSSSISINKGVRSPSLFELYGDRGFQISNDELEEEESYNTNLSLIFKSSSISNSLSLYNRNVSNLISNDISNGVSRYSNISSAQIIGLQDTLSYRMDRIRITASIQLMDSLIDSSNASSNNKKVPAIYHKTLTSSVSYLASRKFSLEIQYRSDDQMYADPANLVQLEKSELLSLKTSFQSDHYQVYFNIDNMLNDQVQDSYNRPAPGRTYSLSLYFSY